MFSLLILSLVGVQIFNHSIMPFSLHQSTLAKRINLLLLVVLPLPWLPYTNAACSSDQCVDFATYADLVDHIHTEQEQLTSSAQAQSATAVPDDNPITVCLCGKAYQGTNVCPTFPYQEASGANDGSLVDHFEMALTISRSVALHCVATGGPCLMDCPQTPVIVKARGYLELIGIRGSFVWSNSAEETKRSKFRVDSGGSLFVSGVQFTK
mmetsp:Transcript_17541/g.40856  ORF Transcript_17541/g.40856 Transcript_17541/m.40856 type:complete len:210 (-) Transcript_17541:91-720(-)